MSPGPFRHRTTGGVTPEVARDPEDHYGKEFSDTPADQPCEMQHAHQAGMRWVHVRQRWFRWLPIEHAVGRYETDACSCTVDCLGRAEAFMAIGGGSTGSGWPTFLCTPHVQWANEHQLLRGPDSGALLAVDAGGVWREVGQNWLPEDRVGPFRPRLNPNQRLDRDRVGWHGFGEPRPTPGVEHRSLRARVSSTPSVTQSLTNRP